MWTVVTLGKALGSGNPARSLRPVHGGGDPDPPRLGAETGQHTVEKGGCVRPAAWLAPWDQETETGREEREEVEGRSPFLSETQEEMFAGGGTGETGPARG